MVTINNITRFFHRLYTISVSRAVSRFLILGDVHVPHQDDVALKTLLKFKEDFKPHETVIIGDFIDATAISTYAHDIKEGADQLHEFEMANDLLDKLKPQVYMAGNHEERFYRSNVPQDYRRLLDPRRWLNIKKRGIKWYDYSSYRKDIHRIGNLNCIHGFGFSKHIAYQNALKYGNVVFGHTHRFQTHTIGRSEGNVTGYNIGCLCDLEASYAGTRDPHGWAHGFGFGYLYKSGNFSFTPVHLKKKTHILGKEYKCA